MPTNTFNSKVSELETKIQTAESKPNITNLATKTELTNVENKIPNRKAFVKKTDYATEISSIKNDYVTNAALTSQLNDLKSQHIADEVTEVDDKVTKNSADILGFESRLKQKENTLNDLEREASFFRGSYYYNQNSYFLFESRSKSFSKSGGSISSWKSTGIYNDCNNTDLFSANNSNNISATLNQDNRLGVTFSGNYMKQNKIDYVHGSVVNIYIVYELKNRRISNPDFTVGNGLFGAVKITTKDVNTSHYQYHGYGICFDTESDFTFSSITNGKKVITFGVDMSFSSHSTNKTQNICVLGKDFIQGINGTTIYAEDIYKHNFTAPDRKFVWSLHYNGYDSYLFVKEAKYLKFNSAINYKDRNLLCLSNISSNWTTSESIKTGLYGNVYDLAVDYVPLSGVKTIYDIHRYLMKKHNII